jgi:shikimate kinase
MDGGKLRNLVLIGMPGAGKSTIGELLAAQLTMSFVDTDHLIEARWGTTLQEIIDHEGLAAFRLKEEDVILAMAVSRHVIATGGSVVYSHRAMVHLGNLGMIIWLDLPLDALESRLESAMEGRGIVRTREQTLEDLYLERAPLYARYAQMKVTTHEKSDEEVVWEILDGIHR